MKDIERRKADHIDISVSEEVRSTYRYWEDVHLVHSALPDVGMEEVDTEATFLGRRLSFPLIITAITGGYEKAGEVNRNLAEACERLQIGMGVGSQRASMEGGENSSYHLLGDYDIPLKIGNIGAPQLIDQGGEVAFGGERMREAMDSLGAHAMAVHLNFLQEVVQPEGDTQARGCLEAIRELAAEVPVMAKETGAGISNETARRLKGAGVVAIDVSGMGGTSFAKVERYRAERVGSSRGARLGQTFGEWGIPAPVSLIWSRVGLPLVASGGVTSGLDMARAMAMGASCTGLAGAILQDALESADRVVETLETFREELRAAMFLTGSSDLDQLSRGRYVVMGRTREWLDSEVF